MNAAATSPIERALALAHRALWAAVSTELAGGDPFAIDLPQVATTRVSVELLEMLGALYLFAELEGGGLMVVAEGIVNLRDELTSGGYALAAQLDAFALELPRMPAKRTRDLLFARLFGLGPLASLERADNHRFLGQLGALCTTLVRAGDARRFLAGAGTGATRLDAQASLVAADLAQGLAARAGADVVGIGRRIHALATRSQTLLSNPELLAVVGVRSPADLIRALAGDAAPDIGTSERRGRAGQHVLRWAGSTLDRRRDASPLPPDTAIIDQAAAWLAAAGAGANA
ncbi:MAG: hypothetical protein HOW73_23970 [Polyangiaceae bacterium]|nr:hypothetical protein [Polyangiaceae bacterium]